MKVFGRRFSVLKLSFIVFIFFAVSTVLFIYYLDILRRQAAVNFIENVANLVPEERKEKLIIVNQVLPFIKAKEQLYYMALENARFREQEKQGSLAPITSRPGDVNYNVHVFYYPWYGNPEHDGKYHHWNHPYLSHWDKVEAAKWPSGTHVPPDDIGANFYPQLGPYSSSDPKVVEDHMKQIQLSGAGKLVFRYCFMIFLSLLNSEKLYLLLHLYIVLKSYICTHCI